MPRVIRLNEFTTDKQFKAAGFKQQKNGWWRHPQYPEHETENDDRGNLKVRDLTGPNPGVSNTVKSIVQYKNLLVNFKKK